MTPDLWVPRDHKPYTVNIAIDARVQGNDKMTGTWKLLAVHTDDESATFGRSGKVNGFYEAADPPQPEVRGGAAVVGRQKVTVEDGHLVFAVTGK